MTKYFIPLFKKKITINLQFFQINFTMFKNSYKKVINRMKKYIRRSIKIKIIIIKVNLNKKIKQYKRILLIYKILEIVY